MSKKNRSTLKNYFEKGTLPSEDHFKDLIDSTLNLVDEGFNKTPANGIEISLLGDHKRLISFFKTSAAKDVVWTIDYDKDNDRLLIKKPDADAQTAPAMTFSGVGHVGVNRTNPAYALDVGGVVAAEGRIGANPDGRKTVPADGDWHNITGPLSGCHAYDVMAGVGMKGEGRYALMKAVAMNTFNPSGWVINFLNRKKKIKCQQAYYGSRCDRIKLRWHQEGEHYYLQMSTGCAFDGGIKIRYYITRLWFDEDMSESWKQDEPR